MTSVPRERINPSVPLSPLYPAQTAIPNIVHSCSSLFTMEPDSPVQMMPHEKKEELANLRSTLQNAVLQRGRYYAEVFSFSVYFEADDTSAFRDTEHFQNVLKMLELPAATELVILANDRNPAGTFEKFIYELDIKAQDTDNKYLILGHYAGHAGLSVDGTSLVFYDTLSKRQRMTLKRTFEPLYDVNEGNFENTDVVIILDSCYSAQAARSSKGLGRSVEIVASVGVDQQALGNASRLARIQNKTFTSRLADEVARRVGRQDTTSISFSEIVEELGRVSLPQRVPEYNLKVGGVGIRLPIPISAKLPPHLRILSQRHQRSSSENSIDVLDTKAPSTKFFACFKVHLSSTDPDSSEMMKLVQWVYSLNPNIGLELTGVFFE